MRTTTPIADYIEDDNQKCGFINHYFSQKRNELYWDLIDLILKEKISQDEENRKDKAKILADILLDQMQIELFKKTKESAEAFIKALFLARSYKTWCEMIEQEKKIKQYRIQKVKVLFFQILKEMMLEGIKPPTSKPDNLLPMPEIKGLTP